MSTPESETVAGTTGAGPRGTGPDALAQRYIVVEGPIGVGKTSLARRLAETLEAELVLEQDAQNPFLERFYRNQKSGALPAQLFFLFQRAQQLGMLKQQDMFAVERGAERRFDRDRLPLAELMPGYDRNREAALAMLAWLEAHADVDQRLASAVRELASA